MQVKTRPLGVTILAVLQALGALSFIALGAGLAFVGAATGIFGALFAIVGFIVLLIGLVGLVVAWGLWSGKGWARFLAIILAVLGALSALFSIVGGELTGLVSLAIQAIILYYLFQPRVKAYFA